MSDEKKPFTVTDRRHFTAEGEARPDAEPPAMDVPREDEVRPEAHEQPEEPADLPGLLVALATQASMQLGVTGEGAPVDLDGARHVISWIEMLQDKTRGNRTPE